jgi:predicted nucleotidyltransferase
MESAAETIKTLLDKVPGIRYAFIYGSFPKRPKNSEGEVDVMVVGGPELAEMDQMISKAEEELQRAINLTSFTVREFRERVKVKDRVVLKALRRPRIMLSGDEKEMERLIA